MARAVTYAEQTLGVHEVYEKALEAHDALVQHQLELETAYRSKRAAVEDLELKQYMVTATLRAKNAELSDTAFNREVKGWLADDEHMKVARHRVAEAATAVEYAEHLVRAAEKAIQIHTARMTELGGYFNYLAAAKNAEPVVNYEASSSPWDSASHT